MQSQKALAVALTIAGSDSGGGAGIQADLKTFAALGVHGTSAITCITAQNPAGVIGIQPVRADMVRLQIQAVFAELQPRAVKTGMLYSADIIAAVADFFADAAVSSKPSGLKNKTISQRFSRSPSDGERPGVRGHSNRPPLVVDPVMVATSGARLLKPSAIRILKQRLLPLATILTPNLDEAEILIGRELKTVADLRDAAKQIHEQFGCAALVKGGHLRIKSEAVDAFYDGKNLTLLRAPRVQGVSTHGTGCTYSAAIAASLALGQPLPRAIRSAKRYITRAIAGSLRIGQHWTLNHRPG